MNDDDDDDDVPTQLSSHRPAHRPEVRYLWKRRGLSPPRAGFDPNTTPNQTLYPQRPQKRAPHPTHGLN